MRYLKRVTMALLVLVILVSGMGASAQPAQAASCGNYHTVRYGESLSWIGRYYGVYWPYLAQINGIRGPRYTVYAGQVLCIAGYSGGSHGGYPQYGWYPPYGYNAGNLRTWSFQVVEVVANTSVTIRTYNAPSNIRLNVRIGAPSGNQYDWIELGDLDTASGGTQTYILSIPAQFANANPMKMRLTQTKKNGKVFQQDQIFYNGSYTGGTGGIPNWGYYPPYYGYSPIPTIWITSVVENNSVTIQTRNFPAGVTFDVLMGPMGTRGIGGLYVGTLNSGAGGTLSATFTIPPELYGRRQIAIRTQNNWTGYYSYNWFYNNTTY